MCKPEMIWISKRKENKGEMNINSKDDAKWNEQCKETNDETFQYYTKYSNS